MAVFLFPYLRGCSIMCSYIPVQFNRQQNIFPCNRMVLNTSMADPLMTIFGHYYFIKRPARDACLCMGELQAPPAPAAPPAPPAPHFVFLITL